MINQPHPYELYLPHITETERAFFPQTYGAYAGMVYNWAALNERYLTEKDVLQLTGKPSLAAFNEASLPRYIKAKDEAGHEINYWIDLMPEYTVQRTDFFYGSFFFHKLRHLDLLDLYAFLDYQLTTHYDGNMTEFAQFLKLCVRKYENTLITPAYALTVNEWIDERKNTGNTLAGKAKGKIKRSPDELLTLLNQELTVLLIHYLQKGRVILKDEYLNNKEAGEAFSLLTGYSADTLRQKLGIAELDRLLTKKNIADLHKNLTRIINLMESDIREKK